MKIIVDSFVDDSNATLSTVTVDGRFLCFGLEDGYNEVKEWGKTRIPRGTYKLGVRNFGGFHKRYAVKFASFHRGMIEVLDVPNYTDILIHVGNKPKDTSGCLLVGLVGNSEARKMSVNQSTRGYMQFYTAVIGDILLGNSTIQYRGLE